MELHAANGYLLLSQFLVSGGEPPRRRTGGTLANRARISMEILRRIKAEMRSFPVIFRLSADDLFPTGLQFPRKRCKSRNGQRAQAPMRST